jgi:hypothetical protein
MAGIGSFFARVSWLLWLAELAADSRWKTIRHQTDMKSAHNIDLDANLDL